MDPICQTALPHLPWMSPATARLPGVQPLNWDDWLVCDDAFAAQMALRDSLLAERRADVYAMTPAGEAAAAALLGLILDHLGPGYARDGGVVTRPDGVRVGLGDAPPLVTAARLVQQDLCLMQPLGGEHVLTGAVLCFPASWTLAEKIGRPLTGIHAPVDVYDPGLAARVQRLFDAVHADRPLWRQNALVYANPALHQPRKEHDPRREAKAEGRYLRSEKQCLVRLPSCDAVAFTIHTYVVPLTALPASALARIPQTEAIT